MSRAMNRILDIEELNNRLEQTIHNLHHFAGRLTSIHDKREVAKSVSDARVPVERPRNNFFNELDFALGRLADNLGYLDGLVSNLETEVFGEEGPHVRSTL